jgi:glycosyltransferase involved in cell wall biosynthesis
MIPAEKILVIFPHNFFQRSSGVNRRYYEFISYLKERGFSIDLLGLKNFGSDWRDFDQQNAGGLINRLYLYDFRIGYQLQRIRAFFRGRMDFRDKGGSQESPLPDYAFPGMVSLFRRITRENRYATIINGYVYWAKLLREPLPGKVTRVLTIEDMISQKIFENAPGEVEMDGLLREEIARVNLFDKVICLSHEELTFFSANAVHPEYFYVPVFMARPDVPDRDKEYDILFIGFDNPDNIEGLEWFFGKVYPLLPEGLRFVIVGQCAVHAPDLPGVTKFRYVENTGDIYSRSRISINPLQKGTGMKVKVVESLAHGIPVVSTPKGLVGMPPQLLGRFIIAAEPSGFATGIVRLLSDPDWYAQQRRMAVQTFDACFETNAVRKELDRVFPYESPAV